MVPVYVFHILSPLSGSSTVVATTVLCAFILSLKAGSPIRRIRRIEVLFNTGVVFTCVHGQGDLAGNCRPKRHKTGFYSRVLLLDTSFFLVFVSVLSNINVFNFEELSWSRCGIPCVATISLGPVIVFNRQHQLPSVSRYSQKGLTPRYLTG